MGGEAAVDDRAVYSNAQQKPSGEGQSKNNNIRIVKHKHIKSNVASFSIIILLYIFFCLNL